jgi:hypothetical protein
MTSRRPSVRTGNDGKLNASHCQPAGRVRHANVTSVTTANVPSAPRGAAASPDRPQNAGPAGPEGSRPAGGQRCTQAAHARWPRNRWTPARQTTRRSSPRQWKSRSIAGSGRPSAHARQGHPPAGRRARRPGRCTTRETRSTPVMRFMRDMSTTTGPSSASAPPHTPEPAPLGITAVRVSEAQASTMATSSAEAGKTTSCGSPGGPRGRPFPVMGSRSREGNRRNRRGRRP